MFKQIIQTLQQHKTLNAEQVDFFLSATAEGKLSLTEQAAVLTALSVKGITGGELALFAKSIRKKMPTKISFPDALDLCGTGGSGLSRINTSTLATFVVSAMGVPVAKHGNKAASGRCGSFDLLESLGVNISPEPKNLEKIIKDIGLGFFFARAYHPFFKHVATVRSELGIPTVFNLLGPLLNPAGTKKQLIGASSKKNAELIAQAAKHLGEKEIMVVTGEDGLDEVTLTSKTFVWELKNGAMRRFTLSPKSFGLKPCTWREIEGGDLKKNRELALSILSGTCTTRHLDLVLINAALALKLSGRIKNLKKAYRKAKEYVMSGKVSDHFLAYQRASKSPGILLDIVLNKKKEVEARKKALPLSKLQKRVRPSDRDFKAALLRPGLSLIAEVKKASPSEGVLKKNFSPEKIAKIYEEAGARAISVLTDEKYFQGKREYLQQIRAVTHTTPLLCKDFIIDEYQIIEARSFGADAVLLMASVIGEEQMKHFLKVAQSLQMNALCEVHTEEELKAVLRAGAEIIGINNRNLGDFTVDVKTTKRLAAMIPEGKIIVAESGIHSKKDLRKLPQKVKAILVGTSLMRSADPKKKISELIGKRKPLLKLCGTRSEQDALLCQKLGVDFLGLNFVPNSHRHVSLQQANDIVKALRKKNPVSPKIVGVFQDQDSSEVNEIGIKLNLDYVQLSGNEGRAVIKECLLPVIKGVAMKKVSDVKKAQGLRVSCAYLLLDSRKPGSGKMFDHQLLSQVSFPYFLAGGISLLNLKEILKSINPFGIDIASGIETEGEVDPEKIKKIVALISS